LSGNDSEQEVVQFVIDEGMNLLLTEHRLAMCCGAAKKPCPGRKAVGVKTKSMQEP
jgi:hypothetical protein